MKKFIFCSGEVLSDNCLAIFEKMKRENIRGKYIWLCSSKEDIDLGKKKLKQNSSNIDIKDTYFYKKNSIKGILSYYLSNYVFYTAGLFEKLPRSPLHKKINLWHGMPLKKIGKQIDENAVFNFDNVLSNGSIFDNVISNSFDVDENKVLNIGSPRNDFLKEVIDFSFKEIFFNDDKVICWLPTFRRNTFSSEQNGKFQDNSMGIISFDEFDELNFFLEKNNLNLLIKLHPMDVLNENSFFTDFNDTYTRIKIMTNKNNLLRNIYFYKCLQFSSALITDYSSIYFDYLILEKPIGIVNNDVSEYQENRGIVKEIYNEMEKSNLIIDKKDFYKFMSNLNDETSVQNMKIQSANQKEIFQSYDLSPDNSKKILQEIGLL
ncbi:CDP-glycerol glycerophosphotransferase family protein [Enterococcus asini]|uniref:CDP-glycerol glycerophosphotransferase family protein n=1 Tax=Enterococcus asini TaxID=57732 RepID=UPI00288C70D8|nr:CDP-glycerol glycerophosphotransferase family protein [Enterococcus asini]MDT2764814.1 CDP-glycerol glycerophosphotransferase family protein [Enterococcus asini]